MPGHEEERFETHAPTIGWLNSNLQRGLGGMVSSGSLTPITPSLQGLEVGFGQRAQGTVQARCLRQQEVLAASCADL